MNKLENFFWGGEIFFKLQKTLLQFGEIQEFCL